MDDIVCSLFAFVFADVSDGRVSRGVVAAADRADSIQRICDISIASRVLPVSVDFRLRQEFGFEGGVFFSHERSQRRLLRALNCSRKWNWLASVILGGRESVNDAIVKLSEFVIDAVDRKCVVVLSYLETLAASPEDIHIDRTSDP